MERRPGVIYLITAHLAKGTGRHAHQPGEENKAGASAGNHSSAKYLVLALEQCANQCTWKIVLVNVSDNTSCWLPMDAHA